MDAGLENPLLGAISLAALLAVLLARRRRPSKRYLVENTCTHPLVDYVGNVDYRPPRKLVVAELVLVALASLALASPYIEYTVVKPLEETAATQLEIPPRPVVVIIIDVSGSMAGEKLEAAKEAMTILVDELSRLNKTIDVGLIAFTDYIAEAIPPTTNTTRILRAIMKLKALGGTMYTYPLQVAYNWLSIYRKFNQTSIIVFASDGLPADLTEYKSVLEKLAEIGVRMYTVFIGRSSMGEAELEYMARIGHGKSYTAETAKDIVEAFKNIAMEAREIIENVTVKARLQIEVEEKLRLTPLLYSLTAGILVVVAALRHRESRLGL